MAGPYTAWQPAAPAPTNPPLPPPAPMLAPVDFFPAPPGRQRPVGAVLPLLSGVPCQSWPHTLHRGHQVLPDHYGLASTPTSVTVRGCDTSADTDATA